MSTERDDAFMIKSEMREGIKFRTVMVPGLYHYHQKIVMGSEIMVTDPCYKPDTWCQSVVHSVKEGTYLPFVKVVETDWCERVAQTWIIHKDHVFNLNEDNFEYIEMSAGVDSGQAGFYDHKRWLQMHEQNLFDNFYEGNCDITLGRKEYKGHAGVYEDWGFVSNTGYGDGSYPILAASVEDKIVGLSIQFIWEDNEDE